MIRLCFCCLFAFVFSALTSTNVWCEDSVEFLNGSIAKGKILQIRKADKEFDFQSKVGVQVLKRTYPYHKVHAVTLNGKRFVLTPKTDSANTKDGVANRTDSEVSTLISTVGKSPPDWLASTKMNHPKTLNLDWPLKAEGKWNESKNVGQYMWGRVNPNVSRWKPGVKLLYEVIDRHQGKASLLQRDWEALGEKYFTLFQDYPRAAYWLQKAKVTTSKPSGVHLAECYWRMGNKAMAMKMLSGTRMHFDAIKLLGDMGEIDRALLIAKAYANTNVHNEANLNAGDALRGAGRLDEAIEYYQRILDRNQARNAEYLKRYRGRASGALEAIKLFDKADVSKVAPGKYKAASVGYNGQLEVEVEIADKKIANVRVTKHREKQFYAALSDTPKQIIDKQGFQDIDGTSGATITSQAIVNATAKAMAKGVK